MEKSTLKNRLINHINNQSKAGLHKITNYLEDNDFSELDQATKTLLLDLADHYMNLCQFVKDFRNQNAPNSRDELFELLRCREQFSELTQEK